MRFAARLGSLTQHFAARFRKEVLPPYSAEIEREQHEDRSGLSTPALLERLEFWVHRTLYDFARDSLKPTFLALRPGRARHGQYIHTRGEADDPLGEDSLPDAGSRAPLSRSRAAARHGLLFGLPLLHSRPARRRHRRRGIKRRSRKRSKTSPRRPSCDVLIPAAIH
jgi:hypothetical protein